MMPCLPRAVDGVVAANPMDGEFEVLVGRCNDEDDVDVDRGDVGGCTDSASAVGARNVIIAAATTRADVNLGMVVS